MAPQAVTETTTREIAQLSLRAAVAPASIDPEQRTVDVIWTTGARVQRGGFFIEPYIEELSLKRGDVRMERLASGRAPVLNNHDRWSLDSVIGVVESARLEGRQGVATLRFARAEDDPDADKIFRKIQDGIITGVSVGYRVHRYERQQDDQETGLPVLRAVDWEPVEISPVTVAADGGSHTRAEGAQTNLCELVSRGVTDMPDSQNTATSSETETEQRSAPPTAAATPPTAVPEMAPPIRSESEIQRAERQRLDELRRMASGLGLEDVDGFVREMNEANNGRGASVDEARAAAFERFYEVNRNNPAAQIESRTTITGGSDLRREAANEGVRNAILHRSNPAAHELNEAGRMYRAMTMMEMAREYLVARGFPRGLTRDDLARLALGLPVDGVRSGGQHSTSDFPLILADVATKELRRDYENAPQTFKAWCSSGTIPDFKAINVVQLGDFPTLPQVLEGGEYEFGTIGEAREQMTLSKYGRRIAFTWEMLINDDLEAFMSLASRIGFAVANLESDLVYDHFLANPTMHDGDPLFHTNHVNTGAGTPAIASLGAGRAAMRKQTGLNGRRLNIMAKYFLVPAALETEAEQLTTDLQPFQAGEVNPFSGKLTPIAEPRLDDQSAVEWYLAANPAQVETLRYAYLRGQSGPMVSREEGFAVDGVVIKVRHVFAVKAIDWRGLYQSDGVDA